MLPLASTPTLPLSTWGIVIIVAITLVSPALGIATFVLNWSKTKRDEERRAREEAEPRHTPGIDQKIEAKLTATEQRLGQRISEVEQKGHVEDNKLHGRISGLRDELKADWDRTSRDIKATVDRVSESVTDVRDAVKEMTGSMKHINQQVQVLDTEVRRANHKHT